MECTSFFVKIGIYYPQAIISMTLMKFTVLYTANIMGGNRLLRKSEKRNGLSSRPSFISDSTVSLNWDFLYHEKSGCFHPSSEESQR